MPGNDALKRNFLRQIATCNVRELGERTLPERILKAVEATPRHEFIGNFHLQGNRAVLFTPDDPSYFEHIYSAVPLIYAGHKWSTNSDPGFVLHLVNLLDIQPGHRVLEVGSGTGWLSAIMARLASDVIGVEISEDLVSQASAAKERLQIKNVSYEAGTVLNRSMPGTFQRIIFTASTFALPEAVFDALEVGGIVGLPIRQRGLSDGFYFLRKESADTARSFASRLCKFVPVQGESGDNTGICALSDAQRLLLEEPALAYAPLVLLREPQAYFMLAPLESFLSKMDSRFAVFDLSSEAEPRSITWRQGSPIRYAFGLCDGSTLSLWRSNEIASYGPDASSLQEELLSACERWRALGGPADIDCGLEISRGQASASGQFEEQRGAFIYRWHYRERVKRDQPPR